MQLQLIEKYESSWPIKRRTCCLSLFLSKNYTKRITFQQNLLQGKTD